MADFQLNLTSGYAQVPATSLLDPGYTLGERPLEENEHEVARNIRSYMLPGVAADAEYSFEIYAYRKVDPDIKADRTIISTPMLSPMSPYQPSDVVTIGGQVVIGAGTKTLDQLVGNVVDLTATYGNTANSAANAAAAAASAAVSDTAAKNAATAQSMSESARAAAQAARDLAANYQQGAQTAQTNAETAKGLAENARTASQAAQSAAESAKTLAQTAQTNAETARTNAQTAATNASTASGTATTQASLATGANTNAIRSAAALFPSDFSRQGQFWSRNNDGQFPSTIVADSQNSFPTDAKYGTVYQMTGNGSAYGGRINPLGYFQPMAGRRYRAEAVVNLVSLNTTTGVSVGINQRGLSSTYAYVQDFGGGALRNTINTVGSWLTIYQEFTGDQLLALNANIVYARPYVVVSGSTSSGNVSSFDGVLQVASFRFADITDAYAANASAGAASTSATNAAASATTSSQQATISTQQATVATTKAGEASTSAGSSASSANTATTQANMATTQAAVAAQTAGYASNYSTGNLFSKAVFTDTNAGQWTAASAVADAGPSGLGRSYVLKSLLTDTRDGPERSGNWANRTLQISGWVKIPSGTGSVGVGIIGRNASGTAINSYNGITATADTWTKFTTTVITGPDFVTAVPFVRNDSPYGTLFTDLTMEDTTSRVASAASAAAAAGSASTASTKADAAGVSADSATASANTATARAKDSADSANAASTSASGASTSATNAGQSASAAQTSAQTASTKAGEASTSANSSASSASDALGSKNSAQTSATNAATSASNADSRATAANTSAGAASTSATNAGNSATAANTSAVNAASSFTGAKLAGAALLPSDFERKGLFFQTSSSGAPNSVGSPADALFTAVSGVGTVYNINGAFQIIATMGVFKPVAGRTYELEASVKVLSDNTAGGNSNTTLQFVGLDANYAENAYVATAVSGFPVSQNNRPTDANFVTWKARYTTAATPASTYLRPRFYSNYNGGSGASGNQNVQLAYLKVTDITDSLAAAASATAAATSASNASTSATNAGSSATAASTSATNASTSAGNANTYANNASTSATNAAGSANTATTQAGVASSANAAATTTATNLHPTTFEQGSLFFGGDGGAATTKATLEVINGVNSFRNTASNSYDVLCWKTCIANKAGKWKVRAKVGNVNGVASSVELRMVGYTVQAPTTSSGVASYVNVQRATPANDFIWVEGVFDSLNPATNPWIRAEIVINYGSGVQTTYVRVQALELIDVTSETNAAASATAAAGSASTASTKADAAGQSANAASASATSANTSAGNASTSAAQASSSATDASGSKNSAATSAGVASTASTQAVAAALSLTPSDFNGGDTYWTRADKAPESGSDFATVNGETVWTGNVPAGKYAVISSKGPVAVTAGRKYQTVAQLYIANGGTAAPGIIYTLLNGDQGGIDSQSSVASGTTYQNFTSTIYTANSNDRSYTPRLVIYSGNYFVRNVKLLDVTEREAAIASASAAATSASTAGTQANNAAQSASAANTSATNANTSAGNASTSASQASTSASNASGSANTASQQATLASNSASNASGSASAANTSAGTASTQASNAAGSASAANTSNLSAIAARDAAQSAALRNIVWKTNGQDSSVGQWGGLTTVADSGPVGRSRVLLMNNSQNDYVEGDFRIGNWGSRRFRCRGWVKSPADGAPGIGVNWQPNGANSALTYNIIPVTTANTWIQFDITTDFTAANATTGRPFLRHDANKVIYWTDLVIEDVTDSLAAAGSATLAAGSASTASTKADAASGSASTASTAANTAASYRDQANTYAGNASTSANSASSSAAQASASATISSSYSSSSISVNDKFANWTDANGYPTGWYTWSGGGNYRIQRIPGGLGSLYGLRTLNDATDESGFMQVVPMHKGWWVMEATARLDANVWAGSGVTLQGVWNIDFARDADTNNVVRADGEGITRTWSKLVQYDGRFSGDQVNFHGMLNWSGFAPTAPKYITWFGLRVRPATQGEIDGRQAKIDSAANTANITTLSNTVSSNTQSLASLTTTVEARALAGGNMLSNTTFPSGVTLGWGTNSYGGGSYPSVGVNVAGDNWHPVGENVLGIYQNGRVGSDARMAWSSERITVVGGASYCVYAQVASHRCQTEILIEWYDNGNNNVGISYLGRGYSGGGGNTAAGFAPQGRANWSAPSNAVQAVLTMAKYDTDAGQNDSFAWFWRPYFGLSRPAQTEFNPYTPGNGSSILTSVTARVVSSEGAIADLQGRTEAYAIKQVVAGAGAAFVSMRAKDSNGNYTSDVGIGASTVSLYNQTEGGFKLAMQLAGGNAVFTGSLNVGTTIRLGSGAGWAVALQQRDFNVGDGETLSYGADLGNRPDFTISTQGMAPLSAGQVYDVRMTNVTSTSATLYAKIITPGQASTYTSGATYNGSSGPTLQANNNGQAESTTGDYFFNGSLGAKARGTYDDVGKGQWNIYSEGYVDVWALINGAWVKITTASAVFNGSYGTSGEKNFTFTYSNIKVSAGAGTTALGMTFNSISNGTYVSMGMNPYTWNVQGATSAGSALPGGAKTTVTVRPK